MAHQVQYFRASGAYVAGGAVLQSCNNVQVDSVLPDGGVR